MRSSIVAFCLLAVGLVVLTSIAYLDLTDAVFGEGRVQRLNERAAAKFSIVEGGAQEAAADSARRAVEEGDVSADDLAAFRLGDVIEDSADDLVIAVSIDCVSIADPVCNVEAEAENLVAFETFGFTSVRDEAAESLAQALVTEIRESTESIGGSIVGVAPEGKELEVAEALLNDSITEAVAKEIDLGDANRIRPEVEDVVSGAQDEGLISEEGVEGAVEAIVEEIADLEGEVIESATSQASLRDVGASEVQAFALAVADTVARQTAEEIVAKVESGAVSPQEASDVELAREEARKQSGVVLGGTEEPTLTDAVASGVSAQIATKQAILEDAAGLMSLASRINLVGLVLSVVRWIFGLALLAAAWIVKGIATDLAAFVVRWVLPVEASLGRVQGTDIFCLAYTGVRPARLDRIRIRVKERREDRVEGQWVYLRRSNELPPGAQDEGTGFQRVALPVLIFSPDQVFLAVDQPSRDRSQFPGQGTVWMRIAGRWIAVQIR